jgi:hypothetical protein
VALIPSIGMFFKRANRETLSLIFNEAKTIERELSSYDHHPHSKYSTKLARRKPLLLTKAPEKKPKCIENVVKLIKKLSNEVV